MGSQIAAMSLSFLNISADKLTLVAIAFVVAAVLAMLLTPAAMKLAERAGVMDIPHARRVHTRPTPRWGGLAMFAAFILTSFLVLFLRQMLHEEPMFNTRVIGILIGATLITALGALDDKYSIPAKVKLAGQILAAAVLPIFGVRMVIAFDTSLINIAGHIHQIPVWLVVIGYMLTILWVVAITNTINLIDGLDGLAAGVSGIAALTFVTIAVAMKFAVGEGILAAALAGVCVGFLRYNFNPAKVFMGDAGSHFLGYTIAALSILQNWKVAAGIALAVPVLALAVPVFDTAFAIIRRLRRGQPIFSPDKGHLHHRLLNMGLNQRAVVLYIYLLTTIGCALALLLARTRLWP